jgi:hypothetical protein
MAKKRTAALETRTIDDLVIDDEASFAGVELYADLREILRRDRYEFRVLPRSAAPRWDRALFLNLTFWGSDAGGDVLVDDHIAADVVAHVAWHHLAARAFAPAGSSRGVARPSVEALVLGEAIASAFEVYLIGRLLRHAPSRSSFLETQVSAMAETARGAGMSKIHFEALLQSIALDPERAFEDLREILCDAARALAGCSTAAAALSVLAAFDAHRFGPLLHRYELSNWLLYARAYGAGAVGRDAAVRAVDQALRKHANPLAWLTRVWVKPALGTSRRSKKATLLYELAVRRAASASLG